MRPRSALDVLVAAAVAGRVVGVEREYTVRGPDGPVDGRTIWPLLQDLGAPLDPGDPHARRIPSGDVVTLDTLRCPLDGCTATLAFPAAPTRFAIPATSLTTTECGTGLVRFVVDQMRPAHWCSPFPAQSPLLRRHADDRSTSRRLRSHAETQLQRWICSGAELWLTGISSMVFTLTCRGSEVTQATDSAMSSAVIGSAPS